MNRRFNKLDSRGGGIVIGKYSNHLFFDWLQSKSGKYELIRNSQKMYGFKRDWLLKCSAIRNTYNPKIHPSTKRIVVLMSSKDSRDNWQFSNPNKDVSVWFVYVDQKPSKIHFSTFQMWVDEADESMSADRFICLVSKKVIDTTDPLEFIRSNIQGDSVDDEGIGGSSIGYEVNDPGNESEEKIRELIAVSIKQVIKDLSKYIGKIKLSDISTRMISIFRKIKLSDFVTNFKDALTLLRKFKRPKDRKVKSLPSLTVEILSLLIEGNNTGLTLLLIKNFDGITEGDIRKLRSILNDIAQSFNVKEFTSKFKIALKSLNFKKYKKIISSITSNEGEGKKLVKRLSTLLKGFVTKSSLLKVDSKLIPTMLKLLTLSEDINLIAVIIYVFQKKPDKAIQTLLKGLEKVGPERFVNLGNDAKDIASDIIGDIDLLLDLSEENEKEKKE